MRISKRYWLWGLFPSAEKVFLNEIKAKKELISNLPELNKPITMSKIALVEVDECVNLWKILESFDLN